MSSRYAPASGGTGTLALDCESAVGGHRSTLAGLEDHCVRPGDRIEVAGTGGAMSFEFFPDTGSHSGHLSASDIVLWLRLWGWQNSVLFGSKPDSGYATGSCPHYFKGPNGNSPAGYGV